VFQELRMIEPYQIRGMETYSTVLYHLQKEMAISALAQDMIDIDQNSAEVSVLAVNFISYWLLGGLGSNHPFVVLNTP